MAVAANNPLLNPNQTLSGPALLQAAQALAKSQTQPVIQQLNQDINASNQHTTAAENLANQYFTQLGQQAQSGVNQTQGIQSALNSQLQGMQGQENSQLQGIGQNAMDTLNKYSPGGAGAGASAIAGEIARQQGLAAQQQGAMSAFGATQGANFSSNAASNLGSFAARGQEDLSQINQAGAKTVQPLTQKLAQERSTYGSDLVTALGKLRQQEITNEQTNAGLGIKQQTANTTAANDAANQKINQGKLGVSQQNAGTAAQKAAFNANPNAVGSPAWAAVQKQTGSAWSDNPNAVGSPAWARAQKVSASTSGGAKPLTTQANNTFWQKTSTLEQLIQDGEAKGGNPQQIMDGLTTGNNPTKTRYDQNQVNLAYELMSTGGKISQSTASWLHNQAGVRGGTYNGSPIVVVAGSPTTSTAKTGVAGVNNAAGAIGQAFSGGF